MVAENVANQQIGMAYGDDHFVTSVTAPAFRNAKEKIPDQWICLPAVSNTKGYPTRTIFCSDSKVLFSK